MASGPAVSFRAVSKRFGATHALRDASLDIGAGTVHALVGANGAGKSTCLGVLAGRIAPDAGTVLVHDRPIPYGDPRGCRRIGISAIYQELTVIPALSALANVFLGDPPARLGVRADAAARRVYRDLRDRLGAGPPPDATAGDLAVADQQLVEIMRGLAADSRVLLFDEPTAALAWHERVLLLDLFRSLRATGLTVVLVSHNLDEVLKVSDEVTVFRDGSIVESRTTPQWTKKDLVDAMLGPATKSRLADELRTGGHADPATGTRVATRPLLQVTGLRVPGVLHGVDLTIHSGEIVGVGGLVGSGRTTLLRSLAGLEPRARGELQLTGSTTAMPRSVRAARRAGIGLLPEDRKRQGLVPQMSAASNAVLADLDSVSRFGVLSRKRTRAVVANSLARFRFPVNRLNERADHFSGGNQQKLLFARWLAKPPRLLLVDEPTRGIDIGAKQEILTVLEDLAAAGTGVVVVSSELEEVAALSHRVYVLSEGHCVGELNRATGPITTDAILRAAVRSGG